MSNNSKTQGAAYKSLIEEESKESLAVMVIGLLRQIRESETILEARKTHDIQCRLNDMGTPFDLCLNDQCVRARKGKSPSPNRVNEDFHFEDTQVITMVQATDYYKNQISYHLHQLTSGEKWSLYRAIIALADAQRKGDQIK